MIGILELSSQLQHFVAEQNQAFFNQRDDKLIDEARNGKVDVDQLIKQLELRFREEIQECADQRLSSEDEQFSQRFHRYAYT